MKSVLLTTGSLVLSSIVIANAYYQKKQFYPSVVYIIKSSPSMAVLYVQAFVCVILMGKLMRKIFFGQLRAAEMEHLIERSWYAVTETCLAFTVFRDDFSPRFVTLFILLLFVKCFHWLADDRIDFMERSPVISWLFHIRAVSLLGVLGLMDILFINHAYYTTLTKGASVQLVFGFEYAILLTVSLHISVKYILHTIDLQREHPWDNKAVYLLYTELLLGFVKVVLYLLFLAIMVKVHTFPLFVIRPMYLTMRGFKKALHDVIMSRRAIRNMNTYPDATAEELSSGDNVCIICREDMQSACKRLPCAHVFHTACLRSWFQRQQSCPTCRMDILRPTPAAAQQQQQQQQAQPAPAVPAQPPAAPPAAPHQPHMFPGGVFGAFPAGFHPAAFPPAWPPLHQPPASAASSSAASATTTVNTATTMPTSVAGVQTVPATGQTSLPGMPSAVIPPGLAATGAANPGTPFGGVFPPGMATGAPIAGMPPGMPANMPFAAMPPFAMPSPFMMPMPFPQPPPLPAQDFSGLTQEELRAMEGEEREQLSARIRCLRDIHTLLDAAMVQIQQYTSVIAQSREHSSFVWPTVTTSPSSVDTSTTTTQLSTTSSVTSVVTSITSPLSSVTNLPTSVVSSTMSVASTGASSTSNVSAENVGSSSVPLDSTDEDYTGLEGAVGFTRPKEESIPEWIDDRTEEPLDEMSEVRRRRIQRFSSHNLQGLDENKTKHDDEIALD